MPRNKKGLLAAVGVAALALTGAGAFTASLNTTGVHNTVVGYGSVTVTGATITSLNYALSSDGQTINGVTFVTTEDTSASQAQVGFNGTIVTSGATDCTATGSGPTTWTCTGLSQSTTGVTETDITLS